MSKVRIIAEITAEEKKELLKNLNERGWSISTAIRRALKEKELIK